MLYVLTFAPSDFINWMASHGTKYSEDFPGHCYLRWDLSYRRRPVYVQSRRVGSFAGRIMRRTSEQTAVSYTGACDIHVTDDVTM